MLISGYGNLGRNGFARCDTRFGSGAGTAVAASYVSQHVNRCMSDQSPELADKKSTSGWKFAIRALRHRNYLLFFSGQTVSLIGTWMTRIATAWLVYRLTHQPSCSDWWDFPARSRFLLGPFAGVWVDRWNRHRVLVVTQTLSMLQSFGLAVLALSHRVTVTDIILA